MGNAGSFKEIMHEAVGRVGWICLFRTQLQKDGDSWPITAAPSAVSGQGLLKWSLFRRVPHAVCQSPDEILTNRMVVFKRQDECVFLLYGLYLDRIVFPEPDN
jgi:hypothetical protein